MSDVFVSHIEEDADLALGVALALEQHGFSTWCYEIDSVPGPTYFVQTRRAVADARVVVVIISPRSIGSHQITRELVRAFELGKEFIPILRDITHAEFQERQPEWRDILGAAASIRVPPEGLAPCVARLVQGMRELGVPAAASPATARIAELANMAGAAPPPPPAPPPVVGAPSVPRAGRRAVGTRARVGIGLAAIVAIGAAYLAVRRSEPGGDVAVKPPSTIAGKPANGADQAPLVMGVMDIRAQGSVAAWMCEFTRDGLNTVLSKAPNLRLFSKQKIDLIRQKRDLTELEAAEQLGITKMISGTLRVQGPKVVLEVQVVDIGTGLLEDSERVEGTEEQLVEMQNRAAVNMVHALKISLNAEDVNRMFARTNDSLDSYRLLTETLGEFDAGTEKPPRPERHGGAWLPRFVLGVAYAGSADPEEAAVRVVLEKYRTALESKDMEQLADVQLEMGDSQRQALSRYFATAGGLKVRFSDIDILVEGDEAVITFTRDDVFNDVQSGRDVHLEVRMSSTLARRDGGWKIRAFKKQS